MACLATNAPMGCRCGGRDVGFVSAPRLLKLLNYGILDAMFHHLSGDFIERLY